MSASLHLANAGDLERLEPLVAAYHGDTGIHSNPAERRRALASLLDGTPHGVIYLIGMRRAPVGYLVMSFGYSVQKGGIAGTIDEFFVRESVRGRGMGTEVLSSLLPALGQHGVKALDLRLGPDNTAAQRFFSRAKFGARDGDRLMSRLL